MAKKSTALPSLGATDELIVFMTELCRPGFTPVLSWEGGKAKPDGSIQVPWPVYHPRVNDFIEAVSRGGWIDPDYVPEAAAAMLGDANAVEQANLDDVKAMLTYVVRGERFSDGHWAAVIESGKLCHLLERIKQLRQTLAGPASDEDLSP
jgi:hypothetical protein